MRAHEDLLETAAIVADAEQQLRELRRRRAVLAPHQDDPVVWRELTAIHAEILAAESAIASAEDET